MPSLRAITTAAAVFVQLALIWRRNWAAQWHLARAVGKRFRGCRAKRLNVDFDFKCGLLTQGRTKPKGARAHLMDRVSFYRLKGESGKRGKSIKIRKTHVGGWGQGPSKNMGFLNFITKTRKVLPHRCGTLPNLPVHRQGLLEGSEPHARYPPPRRVPRQPTLRAFHPLRRALLSARGGGFLSLFRSTPPPMTQ